MCVTSKHHLMRCSWALSVFADAKELGHGSFGTVYEGVITSGEYLGQLVAVKTILLLEDMKNVCKNTMPLLLACFFLLSCLIFMFCAARFLGLAARRN